MICSARPELGPKLNFTVSPGWAASNCFPSWVKVPISDAAAKTVIVPVNEDAGPALDDKLPEPLLEQPAAATAASAAAIRVKRRDMNSSVRSRRQRDLIRNVGTT